MKIRCDVCDREEASVFCAADEAALCGGCDRRVHHANKLAKKHLRFSLLHPSSNNAPQCDICQERRAFLFCREDRAILCRECDVPIHGANEHTKKHNRFLLTGVKLSADCSFFPATSASSSGQFRSSGSPGSVSDKMLVNRGSEEIQTSDTGSVSASSISEYLETLPGWCVEDFLDPCADSNCLLMTIFLTNSSSKMFVQSWFWILLGC